MNKLHKSAVNKVILHCSATPAGRAITVEDIRNWHVNGNGWLDIGYHFVIGIHGEIWFGRPLSYVGAHCKGQNLSSIGICYVGGLGKDGAPCDTRTNEQKNSLLVLFGYLKSLGYNFSVHGHNEYANKACPCFDAASEYCTI